MVRIGGQRIPAKAVIFGLSEMTLLYIALVLATAIRFISHREQVSIELHDSLVQWRYLIVVIVSGISLYYNDAYNLRYVNRKSVLLIELTQSVGIACLILGLIYFFAPNLALGRGIAAIAAPIGLILIVLFRWLVESSGLLNLRPDRLLIVGTGPTGIRLTKEICEHPELNLKVEGFLDEKGENIGKSLVNPGIIGGISDLENIIASQKINRVVLSFAERRGLMPVRELLRLKFAGVAVEDSHTILEQITGRIALDRLSPSWLILSDGFKTSMLQRILKRSLDIFTAVVGIILTAPIMGLVALAVWLEDGSPILFKQKRIGLRGQLIEVMKFRSMRKDSEKSGPAWASKGDNRITRVGAFIRKYRLDELPQFFNVLSGEMSLVGPRPEQPYFCEVLEQRIPYFAQRHSVRPGITGWAQVKYPYGANEEDAKAKLEYDLFYIKHLSILLDLAIMFETVKVVIWGRGAN